MLTVLFSFLMFQLALGLISGYWLIISGIKQTSFVRTLGLFSGYFIIALTFLLLIFNCIYLITHRHTPMMPSNCPMMKHYRMMNEQQMMQPNRPMISPGQPITKPNHPVE